MHRFHLNHVVVVSPLHILRKKNTSYILVCETDASPFSFGDLAMHMLKTILDNDGILTGWEPLSNDGKYDKLCQVREAS